MIGAGGLLHCLSENIDVPGQIGLAGFNGVELLKGLPVQLATMDAGRADIGRAAAEIIINRNAPDSDGAPVRTEISPVIEFGETLKRRRT